MEEPLSNADCCQLLQQLRPFIIYISIFSVYMKCTATKQKQFMGYFTPNGSDSIDLLDKEIGLKQE